MASVPIYEIPQVLDRFDATAVQRLTYQPASLGASGSDSTVLVLRAHLLALVTRGYDEFWRHGVPADHALFEYAGLELSHVVVTEEFLDSVDHMVADSINNKGSFSQLLRR